MKKLYGNTRTHLRLSGKALDYYNATDPISIEEIETEDGYRYNLDDGGHIENNLTEQQLIESLEESSDSNDAAAAYDLITANRAALIDTMTECYRSVLESDGSIQYQIYLWDDGDIQTLEQVQGDNGYLIANSKTRDLYHIATVAVPYFDPWDAADHGAPDDEDERDAEREEIIDWLVDEYRLEGAPAAVDEAIDTYGRMF